MILLRKLKEPCKIPYQAAEKLQNISRNILALFACLLVTSCSSKVPFDILK